MSSFLTAIWQADGTFPSGSFAFSYGIEGVLAQRGSVGQPELAELTRAILRQRWAGFDRVAVVRAFRAGDEPGAIGVLDHEVEAATLTEPLRGGSRRNGAAFPAAHARLGEATAHRLREAIRARTCLGHLPVMQGAVWRAMGLSEADAQIVSGYTVASQVIAAAVRLGAIGALQGQAVLQSCLPEIERFAASAIDADAPLQGFLPFLDIASARHARAELRLFVN